MTGCSQCNSVPLYSVCVSPHPTAGHHQTTCCQAHALREAELVAELDEAHAHTHKLENIIGDADVREAQAQRSVAELATQLKETEHALNVERQLKVEMETHKNAADSRALAAQTAVDKQACTASEIQSDLCRLDEDNHTLAKSLVQEQEKVVVAEEKLADSQRQLTTTNKRWGMQLNERTQENTFLASELETLRQKYVHSQIIASPKVRLVYSLPHHCIPPLFFQIGANSGFEMRLAPSTLGAGGPNQNTSRPAP